MLMMIWKSVLTLAVELPCTPELSSYPSFQKSKLGSWRWPLKLLGLSTPNYETLEYFMPTTSEYRSKDQTVSRQGRVCVGLMTGKPQPACVEAKMME